MFQKMSLKVKLLCSYAFCSACLLLVGLIGYNGLRQTSEKFRHVSDVNLENMAALGKMQMAQRDAIIAVSLLLGTHASASDVTVSKDMADKAVKTFEDAAKAYENIPFVEGEEEQWNEAKKNWQPFKDLSYKLISMSASGNKDDEAARDKLGGKEFADLKQDLIVKLGKLDEFQVAEKVKWTALAHETSGHAIMVSFVLVLLGVSLSILFGFFMSLSLNKVLKAITEKLSAGADAVASASQQISHSSKELSSAVQEQAAAIQETSASVEEMSVMTQKNSESAAKSQAVVLESQKTTETGNQAVGKMLNAMNEIDVSNSEIMQQIEESNRNISEIVKVISEIGNKTKVINDIVFQTKLLSFNASVEAARAGEHGKGFAVVAEEVGNLAQMSGNAAKDISEMLEGSIKKVEEIVQQTKSKVGRLAEVGKEKVQHGSEVAKDCSTVIDEMAKGVSDISSMVSEISTASKEQATGVDQINQAIRQLDQATQQNSSASSEAANAAEQLSAQAVGLRNLVLELNRTIDGGEKAKLALQSSDAEVGKIHSSSDIIPLQKRANGSNLSRKESAPAASDSRFRT